MRIIKNCWKTTMEDVNEHLKSGLIKVDGLRKDNDQVYFHCKDGYTVLMYHEQDCCENVYLENVESEDTGEDIYTNCDWCNIEEISNEEFDQVQVGTRLSEWDDSFTWTFYKIRTNKGYDTLRWYGASNGYYSERVDFAILCQNDTLN